MSMAMGSLLYWHLRYCGVIEQLRAFAVVMRNKAEKIKVDLKKIDIKILIKNSLRC